MKQSLYQITAEQKIIIQEVINAEGEITEEQIKQLEITKKSLNQKSIAYLEVKKNLNSFNEMAKIEIKRLQALIKRNNNITVRLDDALLTAVKTFGTFEVGTNKFGTRKSTSVEVEFGAKLKDKYTTKKLTTTPNKLELKKALQSGIEINGVTLKENLNLKIN